MTLTACSLVDKVGDVSSLPNIYLRLKEVVDDVRSSNRDIAALISEDAGLAGRLLRIANSSFYGAPSGVDTITRAVTVIGTRQISDIVIATSVVNMFDGIAIDEFSMRSFWHKSISSGVAARVLATYRREINVERFFVAGLLHDIGQLIMCQGLGAAYSDVIRAARNKNVLMHVAEKEILGFDHADVGRVLLQKWALPQHMIDAVHYHNNPQKTENISIDTAVTHVAEVISCAVYAALGNDVLVPPINEEAWNVLALPVSILQPLITQMEQQYADAVALIFPAGEEPGYVSA